MLQFSVIACKIHLSSLPAYPSQGHGGWGQGLYQHTPQPTILKHALDKPGHPSVTSTYMQVGLNNKSQYYLFVYHRPQ